MSAEYAIEIAASMPAGDVTNAQLDEMIQGLTGAGKGADFFQVAMRQVSGALDAAKAASAAASASLAEGNAQYRELEKAANQAAKAVEKAGAKGAIDPELSAESARADAALQAYAHTLRSLEQNAAAATKGEAALANQLANVKRLAGHVDKSFTGNAEKLGKLQGSLGAVGGPLGALGQKIIAPIKGFEELSGAVGKSNAVMLLGATAAVGVIAAIVALAAAAVAATVAIAAWAVGLADSARNAKLSTEAMEAMHPELIALRGTIAAISKETGAHADELQEWAGRLQEAKVSAEDMPDALRAVALAEAALGKGGSADFIADLKEAKGKAGELAREVQGKLGPIVAKQMRGLDAQTATLKKNVGEIFGGLNIEPVLAGLERLGALFDQNTVAGQTIKFLFESIFQPLINQADLAAIVIEAFALGFLIGMTKLYIALKPVFKAIAEFFGFDDSTLSDTLDIAKVAGEAVAYIFAGFGVVLGLLAGAIALVVGPALALTAAFYALITAVGVAAAWIVGKVIGAFQAVTDFVTGINLVDVGTNIIMGLANGLVNAGPAVLKAITGVVGNAIGAAKKLLGIASPSKVFAEIGGYTGEGFAVGVEDSTPDAQAAMTDMVDPAPAAAKAGASAPAEGGSSSGGPTVHIENLYLAGAKATEAETVSLSEALTMLIRGDAAALGGGQ
jgi:hypothetical protein